MLPITAGMSKSGASSPTCRGGMVPPGQKAILERLAASRKSPPGNLSACNFATAGDSDTLTYVDSGHHVTAHQTRASRPLGGLYRRQACMAPPLLCDRVAVGLARLWPESLGVSRSTGKPRKYAGGWWPRLF